MRDQIQITGRIDPSTLYDLSSELDRLDGIGTEFLSGAASAESEERLKLADQVYILTEHMDRSGLKQCAEDLENLADKLRGTEASQSHSLGSYWRETFANLRRCVADTLKKLLVFSPQPVHKSVDNLIDASTFFDAGEFELLPENARRDFDEAGLCYLFEQYTAAVALAYRAVEATLREYYYRLAKEEPGEDQTWGILLRALQALSSPPSKEIIDELMVGKDKRNKYAHPNKSMHRPKAQRCKLLIHDAIKLCCTLIDDLKERKLKLSVLVREPVDFDEALAMWILSEQDDGIGRVSKFTWEGEKELEVTGGEVVIGGRQGEFKWPTSDEGECIAQRMAQRYQCEHAYENLTDFACLLRYRPSYTAIVKSSAPEETLEMMLESLGEICSGRSDEYLRWAWDIIAAIHSLDLDPLTSPHIARELLSILPNRVIPLVERAEERLKERLKPTKRECEYDSQRCIVVQSNGPVSIQEFHNKFPYVCAYDTKSQSLCISYEGKWCPELKPIHRTLKERYGLDIDNGHWILRTKAPARNLTADGIVKTIREADQRRVAT